MPTTGSRTSHSTCRPSGLQVHSLKLVCPILPAPDAAPPETGEVTAFCDHFAPQQAPRTALDRAWTPANRSTPASSMAGWSLATLREKPANTGARLARHAQRLMAQVAEVAVPRDLLGQALGRTRLLLPVLKRGQPCAAVGTDELLIFAVRGTRSRLQSASVACMRPAEPHHCRRGRSCGASTAWAAGGGGPNNGASTRQLWACRPTAAATPRG